MFWYGWFFFTLGMLGVWLLVMLYTLIVKPKDEISSTFYRGLKRSGVLLLVYVIVVIVGAMLFSSQYGKECRPNTQEVEIMTPQAEAITKYILENGLPESMIDIPDLPYQWDNCEKNDEIVENCYFNIHKNEYSVYLNTRGGGGTSIIIKIDNKKSETGIFTRIKKSHNEKNIFEDKTHFMPYSTKNDGICNPMRM